MARSPEISDAEWDVMNVLWDDSPQTAAEVVERLAKRRDWSPRTVKTLLNRLVKKGALAFDTQGNRYLYRPAVTRAACVRDEGWSFLSRVFGGAVGPAIVHFVNTAHLSEQEVEELKRLLDARKHNKE